MRANADLNFGAGRPRMDLPDMVQPGQTFRAGEAHWADVGGDGYIHLSTFFAPELSDRFAMVLFETIIHEALHFTLPRHNQNPENDWNHSAIIPEANRRAEQMREEFLEARKRCACP